MRRLCSGQAGAALTRVGVRAMRKGEGEGYMGRAGFETARLRLARLRVEGAEARSIGARHALAISSEALSLESVGIWIFNDRARLIECEQRYVASTRTFSSGTTLAEKDYPLYFDALRRRRAVAADDALTDSATAELRESYLVPNGISSLLAAPLIRGGRLVGVVCHEHVGAPREWQQREIDFASTVADMVALVFEQCDRLTLEASLAAHAEQALENQKSEALRRLARAVGHDINNVLTSLSLSGGQLEQHNDPAVRELAGNVAQAVGLVHALAKQLLELGRASLASVRPSDVRAIIEAERMALAALLAGRATLSVDDRAKSARVGVEGSEIERVLLNLTSNARDAIKEHGRVSIVLREPTVEDGVTHDHLILEFSDDGVGMDEATRSRVFEPYFTTKDQGTGLGLALVHSAVVRAGGEVHVESSPGHGARFIVALPLAH